LTSGNSITTPTRLEHTGVPGLSAACTILFNLLKPVEEGFGVDI
jgi:hypothetical protein